MDKSFFVIIPHFLLSSLTLKLNFSSFQADFFNLELKYIKNAIFKRKGEGCPGKVRDDDFFGFIPHRLIACILDDYICWGEG